MKSLMLEVGLMQCFDKEAKEEQMQRSCGWFRKVPVLSLQSLVQMVVVLASTYLPKLINPPI